MSIDCDSLFDVRAGIAPRFEVLGGRIPALIVDDFLKHPEQVREAGLGLPFEAPPYPYPGGIAQIPDAWSSIDRLKRVVLDLVNGAYFPRLPPINKDGVPIERLTTVLADFAVIDVPPDELSQRQRIPHVDQVPIFGLVYLNAEERGGTLFFAPRHAAAHSSLGSGYLTGSNDDFELLGRIEGRFNRLAIYPGFIPHSGDIGPWIEGPGRTEAPRLTLRLPFFP